MQIEELQRCMRKLELVLEKAIINAVEVFNSETGYSPQAITVLMINTTSFDDDKPHYMVQGVKVSLNPFL